MQPDSAAHADDPRGVGQVTPVFDMGVPVIDLTKALRLADEAINDGLAADLVPGTPTSTEYPTSHGAR